MNREMGLSGGIEAAAAALEAIAVGDELRAQDVLNRLTHAEALWCAATLLGGWRDSLVAIAGGDATRVSRALSAGVAAIRGEDLVVNQFAAAIAEHERRNGND